MKQVEIDPERTSTPEGHECAVSCWELEELDTKKLSFGGRILVATAFDDPEVSSVGVVGPPCCCDSTMVWDERLETYVCIDCPEQGLS